MDDLLKLMKRRVNGNMDLSSCCICHSSPTAERIHDMDAIENSSGSHNMARKTKRVKKAHKRRAKAKMKRFVERDRVND